MKDIIKHYTQPAFLICTAILLVAAGGMSVAVSYLGLKFLKEPLPLKKSFAELNESALLPWKVTENGKHKIPKDIIKELGTEQYIQWMLEDTSADPTSPARYCSLFITYYTGNPDQVPHVPEECYLGGGKILPELPTELSFDVTVNGKQQTIPVKCVPIANQTQDIMQGNSKFDVFYFFKVNGVYAGNRNNARLVMQANFFSKYSYFSKVEWRFYNPAQAVASTDITTAASQKFLQLLLPVLENDHWPDWEKAQKEK